MSLIKCFDVASMVIEDANERFEPLWSVNDERVDILKQYCEVIDSLSTEFNGLSFETEIDEITMEVSITLECEEMIVESLDHAFYKLVKRAIRYGFSASKEGTLLIKFVFPSLWDKV